MHIRKTAVGIAAAWLVGFGLPVAKSQERSEPKAPTPAKRKVLVELYTSQGCNSCPAAEKVFGRLEQLGVDRSRVVPLAFHVDYFNKPWKDPYSDPVYSRREYQYSLVYQKAKKISDPNYLYFTPMMMIDGRYPMLGSNAPEAKKSLEKALAEKPGVLISAEWDGAVDAPRRTLKVKTTSRTSELNAESMIVGVALTEDSVATKVESGENGGHTLTEHHVVRKFDARPLKLERGDAKTFEFTVERPKDVDPAKLAVAVFVQSLSDGRIHQAESLSWKPVSAKVPKP